MALEKFDYKLVLKNNNLSVAQIANVLRSFYVHDCTNAIPVTKRLAQARLLKQGVAIDVDYPEYYNRNYFEKCGLEVTFSEREIRDPYQQCLNEHEDYVKRLKSHLEKLDDNDPSFAILSETLAKINFGFFSSGPFA